MNIVKVEVRTYIAKLMCDCGGEFKSTGTTLTSCPPKYPHLCSECGEGKIISGMKYPQMIREEV